MVNLLLPCSRICSPLFHECSANVLSIRTPANPCVPRLTGQLKDACSICSGILYPFRYFYITYIRFYYKAGVVLFCPEGSKVTEQNEHNSYKQPVDLIYQDIRPCSTNRTKPEQNTNTVRNNTSQHHVQGSYSGSPITKAVRLVVRFRSVLFGHNPNSYTSYTTRYTDGFNRAVRFVRAVRPLSEKPIR